VFAVTSQIFFADTTRRREETGKTRARFRDGFFDLSHDAIDPADEARETIPVLWAGGGSCAIDRRKYVSIGGLDPLYHPFYVEDTDLSYQAWKRGWKCLLAPASRVVHKHRSTSKTRFGNDYVDNTIRKNQYLFIWKNVTDIDMTVDHLLNLPRIHGRAMLFSSPMFEVRAFFRALRQLPEALRKRLANAQRYVLTDSEVLARSQKS
jgi:GT2 family glycosyltransferase